MKQGIVINQLGIVQSGLHDLTDFIDWAIIDYLQTLYFDDRRKTMFKQVNGNHYALVNYTHLIEEMPMLGINDKNALTNRFKKLKQLGLINTIQAIDNSLYFILTSKCIEIIRKTTINDRR